MIDIVALTLAVGGEFGDQVRQQQQCVGQQLAHRWTGFNAVFQHAVEQVFHRPGQLAEDQRAHHPAAALEGVESAAQFAQGGAVIGLGRPARQVFAQYFEHFPGFFEEHFAQLVIHRFFVGRWRQQAAGRGQCRRVDRRHRAGQHFGQRLHDLRIVQFLQILHHQRFAGAEHIVEHRHMRLAGLFVRKEAETGEAFLRDIQQMFAGCLRVVGQAFEVILEAGDSVGEAVELLPARLVGVEQQMLADKSVAGFEQTCRARQRNHRQCAAHLGQQRR